VLVAASIREWYSPKCSRRVLTAFERIAGREGLMEGRWARRPDSGTITLKFTIVP
jgi:hypothetical protein